jgi:hypothetical protein
MELGNMIFGHSRGEYPIPRGDGYEEPLVAIFDALDADHGLDFENEVFAIHAYYWGDCTCGYEDREDSWSLSNEHESHCYQIELRSRLAKYDRDSGYAEIDREAHGGSHHRLSGFDTTVTNPEPGVYIGVSEPRHDAAMERWREAYDKRREFEESLYAELCAKYEQPDQGCAVHCTCSHTERWERFLAENEHDPACPIVRPNFIHKPSGLEVRWYKYPLRDSYMNVPLSLDNWRAIMRGCLESLKQETS